MVGWDLQGVLRAAEKGGSGGLVPYDEFIC